MTELIKKLLPENLWEIAGKLTIPQELLENRAGLVQLVLESKSLEKIEEKQNRFDLYPLMTDEQIDKLEDILTREKEKLQEIENKYKGEKGSIKDKATSQFNDKKYYEKMSQLKSKEQEAREREEQAADDLLSQI